MALPIKDGKDKRRSTGNMVEDFIVAAGGARLPNVSAFGLDAYPRLPLKGRELLEDLLQLQLLTLLPVRQFLDQALDQFPEFENVEMLGGALIEGGLLTRYQLERVLAGTPHGLVLGNYRVMDRLGAGSMAVVFLAEHFLMKRRVAIKVLPVDDECPSALLDRFYGEIRVLADLHHPNIVLAYDAGELPPAGPRMPALLYLVMELVDGGDLEQHLVDHGLPTVAQACEWICQAACGLQEAHDHHLVHRDLKPSNLLQNKRGQVKLVDFGLARQFCSSMTSRGVLLGSVEFMSPEQSLDPTAVSAQADIYGLGATLFWLLTGELPYPPRHSLAAALRALQAEPPRRLRSLRPEIPEELDDFVNRMLERNPSSRPATPLAVMNALGRFTTLGLAPGELPTETYDPSVGEPALTSPAVERVRRVLLVNGEPAFSQIANKNLQPLGCSCDSVWEGKAALDAFREQSYDVVIVDLHPPDMSGYELCRRLRETVGTASLRILVTARSELDDPAEALCQGADDYLVSPFDPRQLAARVQRALQMKDALERYEQLTNHLRQTNHQLENSLEARAGDVRQAQDALLFAMAKMAESRDGETSGHLRRLQRFSLCLAERAAADPAWSVAVDAAFLEQLQRCVPLHDIGKIGLPDQLLTKPGALDPDERALMETHTLIGANILEALGREHGESLSFLGTARSIVRHHHERYDGRGYPDHLAGEDIPMVARVVAVADVYDALRRKRFHKPALPHEEAARFILEGSDGQFDPVLRRAFATCQGEFERIFREIRE